jgi:hypothetical protein
MTWVKAPLTPRARLSTLEAAMKPAVLLAHPSRKSLNAAIVKAIRGAVSGRADRRETL